jgi:hypothetical protein
LLPRLLFCLTAGLALTLGGLVGLAGLLDPGGATPSGWSRLVAVFARDAVVRRTAAASAAGLLVTACVFFRPPRRGGRDAKPSRSPSNRVIGA